MMEVTGMSEAWRSTLPCAGGAPSKTLSKRTQPTIINRRA